MRPGLFPNGIEKPGSDLVDQLATASGDGNLQEVQKLLHAWQLADQPEPPPGPPGDEKGPFWHALVFAIKHGHLHVAKYLLDQGFQCSWSGIDAAIETGSTEMLQAFLDHGWDINDPTDGPWLVDSRVMSNEALRDWFLAHGADPNISNGVGWTALDVAASSLPLSVVESLINHGGKPRLSSALPRAAKSKTPDALEKVVYLLDHGAPINALEYEFSPYFFDLRSGLCPTSALHSAVGRQHEEMVKLLLNRGADPNVKNAHGNKPITGAEWRDNKRILAMLREFGAETVAASEAEALTES